MAHVGWALGQRVWNTQPDGGAMGLGMSPSSTMRVRDRMDTGTVSGSADRRATVYGSSVAAPSVATSSFTSAGHRWGLPLRCRRDGQDSRQRNETSILP